MKLRFHLTVWALQALLTVALTPGIAQDASGAATEKPVKLEICDLLNVQYGGTT